MNYSIWLEVLYMQIDFTTILKVCWLKLYHSMRTCVVFGYY
jgi:hypothetical protein